MFTSITFSHSSLVTLLVCIFMSIMTSTLVAAASTSTGNNMGKPSECHGKICQAIQEYCSTFSESCASCASICDKTSHNFHMDMCATECPEYMKYEPLQAEIQTILTQQTVIMILLGVLLAVILLRYALKCLHWLRQKRCVTMLLKKLRPSAQQPSNAKNLGVGATIPNIMAINDIERAPSQIYSVTAGAEGSVMTMTTPVSTRYPAENSTPTSVPAEYSYDNQALAITPVSDKPSGASAF